MKERDASFKEKPCFEGGDLNSDVTVQNAKFPPNHGEGAKCVPNPPLATHRKATRE